MLVFMQTQEPSTQPLPAALARSWQVSLFVGIVTLILGIIVAAHPTGSLNVIAVLLGILLIISGLFHLIRVFDPGEPHRIWLGIAGLLFIVVGVILIRHLHLTRAIIGLFIGITWIIQGLAALIAGLSRRFPRGPGLVDRLRRDQPHRGHRGRRHPGVVDHLPGRPGGDLVRRDGHLRDHRVVHIPARAAQRLPPAG